MLDFYFEEPVTIKKKYNTQKYNQPSFPKKAVNTIADIAVINNKQIETAISPV
jgi:hypothetical protein